MIEGQAPTAGQSSTDVNTPAPVAPATTSSIEVNATPSPEALAFVQWIREDLAAGKMTEAQADQALKEVNGQGLDQLTADKRTGSERAYDEAHPVVKAHDIPWPYAPDQENSPEYSAFRNSINGYFVDAGVTKETAAFILKQADAFGHRSEKWDENDHVLFGRSEMAKLECVFGDQLPQKLELARQMVQKLEAKRPGLADWLDTTGLGNDAGVILALANHCARLSTRSQPR
jgi:hypothetical protein